MQGYDLEMIHTLTNRLGVPMIVSGGCGSLQHAIDALEAGASAVAISSMFLFTDHSPIKLRSHLASRGLDVRTSASSRN
jgi:cyclase